jgi:hypothetical protein
MTRFIAVLALILAPFSLTGQSASQPDPPHHDWHATWITHPAAPLREPLVLHFRRTLDLTSVPAAYTVRVSADNRFILYVNGHRVGDGPARGDLAHWRYERFDLAPFLQAGSNLITATVWNFGVLAPIAQIRDRTAFLLESKATGPGSISTPDGWLVEIEPGQTPLPRSTLSYITYYAAGPGEQIDASQYVWASSAPTPGPNWVTPGDPMRESAFPGTNRAHSADTTGDNPWALVPDELPPMEYSPTSVGSIVRTVMPGGSNLPPLPTFEPPSALVPNSHYNILLDRRTLTTAYPSLTVSGGKGARIVLTYSEALYDDKQHKADRDSLTYTGADGAQHPRRDLGLTDSFLPDGSSHRTFTPLWWRTWRYLDIDITTANEPLTLESLTANFTAYPFTERASFTAANPASDPTLSADLAKIWEISWRTARLDAHETYMDTPYYEQLQYIGDTRVQALISYTVANDDRLARQALSAFDDSRSPDGLTRSRYPSSLPQTIPTFSLLYIGMLHDYWMYRPDTGNFINAKLNGVRAILDWYAQFREPAGLLHKTPWWSFIDWVGEHQEIPTYSTSGESCVTTLEYLGALDQAADLELSLGDPVLGRRDRGKAQSLRTEIARRCWSPSRHLLADNPDQNVFSQQANILGVLYDVIPKSDQQAVLQRVLTIDPGTTPDGILSASYYFRFYFARALDHAGLADNYLQSLAPWRKLLPLHFSTWPETPGDTRSDSHAWSAHPIYDLLTLVAGIEPASPAFKTVRIAPHLGDLPSLSATFPHPSGPIQLNYVRHGDALDSTITLPAGLSGEFLYRGKITPLHPGLNQIHSQ